MANIFVDTAGWGHLIDPSQSAHKQALMLYHAARQNHQQLITTNYILTELVALLTSPLHIPRSKQISFMKSIKASQHVTILHVDALLDAQAWHLLTQRPA